MIKLGYSKYCNERGEGMRDNEHFYVSSELAEVVDLVFERENLLKLLRVPNENIDDVTASLHKITARLETLIKHKDD